MARTRGARNADYDEARLALARRVRERVMAPDGLRASLRDYATAAGASVATLKHYFGDRQGLLTAVMESHHVDAAPYLAMAATPVPGDVRASLWGYLSKLKGAWFKFEVGLVQSSALAGGLATPGLGPAYVNHVLEPLLGTVETLLARHVELGDLEPLNTRFGALQFLSPVVLALFHQDSLSGDTCRPLDLDVFFEAHVEMFLRAHPPKAPAASKSWRRARRPATRPAHGRAR